MWLHWCSQKQNRCWVHRIYWFKVYSPAHVSIYNIKYQNGSKNNTNQHTAYTLGTRAYKWVTIRLDDTSHGGGISVQSKFLIKWSPMVTTMQKELPSVFRKETSKPKRINLNVALFLNYSRALIHIGQTATGAQFNKQEWRQKGTQSAKNLQRAQICLHWQQNWAWNGCQLSLCAALEWLLLIV